MDPRFCGLAPAAIGSRDALSRNFLTIPVILSGPGQARQTHPAASTCERAHPAPICPGFLHGLNNRFAVIYLGLGQLPQLRGTFLRQEKMRFCEAKRTELMMFPRLLGGVPAQD